MKSTTSTRFSYILLIFVFALLPTLCFGQGMVVYGKVVSNKSNLPVIGANIVERGDNNGTISDQYCPK